MTDSHRSALSTMLFAGVKPRPEGFRESHFVQLEE